MLPWEFLHGGDDLDFLAVKSHVAIVRDLSPERPERTPRTKKPIKLLIAWATPLDMKPLEVEKEVLAIENALAPSVGKGRATVDVLQCARPETFIRKVQEGYDLIHFTGHGGTRDGTGVLFFEDEDRDAVSMEQSELIALLAEAPTFTVKTPKLVVLNACETAESGESEGLAGLAAALVTAGKLPAVAGMGYRIADESASIFSRAFYETLVRHGQVDHAVAKGREALFAEIGAGQPDWGVPRLYMRTPKGIIFDIT
jgi:CHAT domain-containing protein